MHALLLDIVFILAGIAAFQFGRKNLGLTLGIVTLAVGVTLLIATYCTIGKSIALADTGLSGLSEDQNTQISTGAKSIATWGTVIYLSIIIIGAGFAFLLGKYSRAAFLLLPVFPASVLLWILSGSNITAIVGFSVLFIGWLILSLVFKNKLLGICVGFTAGWYVGLGVSGLVNDFTPYKVGYSLLLSEIQGELALAQNSTFDPKSISPGFFAIMLFCILAGAVIESIWFRLASRKRPLNSGALTPAPVPSERDSGKFRTLVILGIGLLVGAAVTVAVLNQIGHGNWSGNSTVNSPETVAGTNNQAQGSTTGSNTLPTPQGSSTPIGNVNSGQQMTSPTVAGLLGSIGKLAEAQQRVEMTKSPEQRQAELDAIQASTQGITTEVQASASKEPDDKKVSEVIASLGKAAEAQERVEMTKTPQQRQAELERTQIAMQTLQQSAEALQEIDKKEDEQRAKDSAAAQGQVSPTPWPQSTSTPLSHLPTSFSIPTSTLSPDHLYGVTVPIFDVNRSDIMNDSQNQVVEVATGRILAVIHGLTGYNRSLNFRETLPARWSPDGSILVWEVDGKWFPNTLVVLKIENGEARWQTDIMKVAQKAILDRTEKAFPEKFAAAKKANAGNYGSAYPDGFAIDVDVTGQISFPLHIQAALTANPKLDSTDIDSHLEGAIDSDGNFITTDFGLGRGQSSHF